MIPGQVETQPGDIEINAGRRTARISIANSGDRPIQVGSHFHFFETNAALQFDRDAAIARQAYAEMFGPTTGDRVRLADTELWIEIEKDYTVYGEEVKFGGGKVIRDGRASANTRM